MARHPVVGVVMGSQSDWETMRHAVGVLDELGVSCEARVVSAHRTPDLLFAYATEAERRGLQVVVAGAGGAAHLPGMLAAKTALPVLGVPVESAVLHGVDSLLSIVQMPAGVPVGTLAIGRAGAVNAGLLAAAIVARTDRRAREALARYRAAQTAAVLEHPDPEPGPERPAGASGPQDGAGGAGRRSRSAGESGEPGPERPAGASGPEPGPERPAGASGSEHGAGGAERRSRSEGESGEAGAGGAGRRSRSAGESGEPEPS